MTSKKATRRALFLSIISMLLCVSMLVGTTFAWFTDEVKSGTNVINAGNLDVELYYGKSTNPSQKVDGTVKLFTDANGEEIKLWEPGVVAYENLTVSNEGSLALKYQMALNFENATATPEGKTLADVLKVAVVKGGFTGSRADAAKLNYNYTLSGFALEGKLEPGTTTDTYGVVIYWQPGENDNDYNMNNGKTTVLSIDLGVKLYATQQVHENDSFGNDYDMNANVPAAPSVSQSAPVVQGEETKIESSLATASIPADAVTSTNENTTEVTSVTLKVDETAVNGNVVVETNEGAMTLDISLVDQNGDKVKLADGKVADVGLFIGKNLDVTGFHHYENDIPHRYDATTGILSFSSGDFSPFTVTYKFGGGLGTAEDPYVIMNEGHLNEALAKGGYFVLGSSLNISATKTVASGVDISLNLDGKTITGTNTATATHNDLFLVQGNMTVNNGTITLTHNAANMEWNGATSVFDVTAGGVLNLNGVTVENLGGTDMNFVVHLNNWGAVTLNVENSTLNATYCPVRVFNSGFDMNNVTIKNTTLHSDGNRAFWVHNYLGDLDSSKHSDEAIKARLNFDIFGNGNTFTAVNKPEAPIRYGFGTTVFYNADGAEVKYPVDGVTQVGDKEYITNANGLNWALENGKDVVLGGNLTVSANETTANSGYGATGIKVAGTVLDGNNNTLTVKDAWATWDCAVNPTGGTIKNLKINSAMRGIFMGGANSDLYVDNVIIDGTIYTFNSDAGNKNYGVYISNSTLNGWTSFSDAHKEVVFDTCNFGEGNGYAFCRPYNACVFKNCRFEEGFEFDTTQTSAITFEGCYYGDTLITAENAQSLSSGETTLFYNGLNGITIK